MRINWITTYIWPAVFLPLSTVKKGVPTSKDHSLAKRAAHLLLGEIYEVFYFEIALS